MNYETQLRLARLEAQLEMLSESARAKDLLIQILLSGAPSAALDILPALRPARSDYARRALQPLGGAKS